MIRISPYKCGDIFKINAMEKEFDLGEQDILATRENVAAYSVFDGEKIIAVFGFTRIFEHVYEGWSILSEDIKKIPVTVVRIARIAIRTLKARRIQMTTRFDLECGKRWARLLGFEQEGILRKYGPDGADHILYARVA